MIKKERRKQLQEVSLEGPTMLQNIHDKKEFKEFLKGAGSHLAVVHFSAKWCGPCKMIRPLVHELAVRYENVLFCSIDVDLAEDVADLCNIVAMPTFQFFMKEEKIFEITGANAKKLEAKIKELM